MRVLYDLGQGNAGTALLPPPILWKILVDAKPTTFSTALTAIDAKEDLKGTLSVGRLVGKHRIAPSIVPPSMNSSPSPPPVFNWHANGGGQTHRNNQFIVRFYDTSMNVIIFADSIATTSYQPSTDEWQRLKDGGFAYWSVAGSNLDDPSSGPYLSGLLPTTATNAALSGNP
jgi:hypothetical protein